LKRFFVIFALFSVVLSSVELDELLKFSNLIKHFQEHQQLNNQLTFSDFLFRHYSIPDDHDGDSEKDEKLPFKKPHDCFLAHIQIVLHHNTLIKLKLIEEQLSEPLLYLEENLPQGSLSNIWQPPKFS
jgi:hypothetical protein